MSEKLDPLVDGAEADEMTKAKQTELDRLAEFGVYETLEVHVALGKKRVTTRWELDHRTESGHDLSQGSSRAIKQCMMSSRRARVQAQDASSTT